MQHNAFFGTYFLFLSTQKITGNISVRYGKCSCWKINF